MSLGEDSMLGDQRMTIRIFVAKATLGLVSIRVIYVMSAIAIIFVND
jgi:hypothetical protein